MRSTDLERTIIGALALRPGLLAADERLTAAVFSIELDRRIFSALAQAREDGRDIPDEGLLAQAAGISLADVSRITSGCYVPEPENFRLLVSQFLAQRAGERILKLSQAEAAALVKSGEIGPEKIREIIEVWREIEAVEAQEIGRAHV